MTRRKRKPTIHTAGKAIRGVLKEAVDPSPTPTELDDMWREFGDCCAFCGRVLVREKNEGHADHLIPDKERGSNTIRNRVLSCSDCNSKGKRDRPWQDLLAEKCPDDGQRELREQRIKQWHAGGTKPLTLPACVDAALAEKVARFKDGMRDAKQDLQKRFGPGQKNEEASGG